MKRLRAASRWLAVTLLLIGRTTFGATAGSGFLQGWTLPEGSDSHSVAIGDVDGDLDAWTTNGDGATQPSAVWLNDGSGSFTASGWTLASKRAARSAIGNLDGDSDADILVVSFDGDHEVWLNQLSGPIFVDGFDLGNAAAWSAVVP